MKDPVQTAQLIWRAQAGDREAGDSLIKLYENLLLTIVRSKVSHPDDVPDVYQEVCIAIWKNIGSFNQYGDGSPEAWVMSLEAWVMQIARHKCVDHSRSKENREVPHSDGAIAQVMDETSLAKFNMGETEYHSTVTRIELDEVIEQLPLIYREVVELFHREGKSISEIASEKNLPKGTVKRRLHEARKKLCEYFD